MQPSREPQPDKIADGSFPTLVSFASLGIVCLALTLVPLRASHDEWWHLKTGMWIDERGLPETEIFTYTAEHYPWHNHEWLAQVLLWRIYKVGELHGFENGLRGIGFVILFKAMVITSTFLGMGAFLARRTGAPVFAALACAMAAGLGRRTFYPRPPFLTYALMALTLCLLLSWRAQRRPTLWVFALVPLFAFWANLHGGFLAGLIILGAFWVEALAGWGLAIWRSENTAEPRRRFHLLTGLLALCFGATLLTPYGIHLYSLAGRVMNDARLVDRINELLPPDWRFVWILDGCLLLLLFSAFRPFLRSEFMRVTFVALLGFLTIRLLPARFDGAGLDGLLDIYIREAIAIALLVIVGARSSETIGLAPILLCIFFAHHAIHHVRHLPLFGLMLAPVLAQSLTDWSRWRPEWRVTWKGSRFIRIPGLAEASAINPVWPPLRILCLFVLCLVAGFYLLWPGEGAPFVWPDQFGTTRAQALRAPSLLDRNAELLKGTEIERGAYPVAAVDFLLEARPPGRLFNGGNYAGYLIWRLSPEKYKVFTDNRYDIWGGDFIEEQDLMLGARPGWSEALDRWGVNTVFIPVSEPLQRALTGAVAGDLERSRIFDLDARYHFQSGHESFIELRHPLERKTKR
jgi:hypothetical protein